MNALITGANGQLGQELTLLLKERGVQYTSLNREQLDVTNEKEVQNIFERIKPGIVYHCAAYTAVDAAEEDDKNLNWLVNDQATRIVAHQAEKIGAVMVYISTDYVFDGNAVTDYQPIDSPNPQTEYGKAKLAGEKAVEEECSNYYIIRTSWVFGQYGQNFVYTMKRLAQNHSTITVVDDQFGRPTWTRTLAEFMLHVVETKQPTGIYHLSNDESCTWYEFAKEILKDLDVEITPVNSSQYPQKATRPKRSIMDLKKSMGTGFNIPTWKEALSQFQVNDKL